MTVPSEVRVNVFQGNSATLEFNTTYKLFDASDCEVRLRDTGGESGTGTLLTLGSDYLVGNLGTESALITMAVAPPSGQELEVARWVPYTQETDIKNQGGFYPVTLENRYDRNVMMIQQNRDSIGALETGGTYYFRSLSTNEPAGEWDIGADKSTRTNKNLGFDNQGDPILTVVPSEQNIGLKQNKFVATAGQTVFTLSDEFATFNFFQIFVGGVYQVDGWTISSTTLTFDEPIAEGTNVTVYGSIETPMAGSDLLTQLTGAEWPYTESSLFYGPWSLTNTNSDQVTRLYEFSYPTGVGTKPTESEPEVLPPHWRFANPVRETDYRTLYPSLVLGNHSILVPSMRSCIVGPYAGSGSFQTNTQGAYKTAYTPEVKYGGAEFEPIFAVTLFGERSFRGSSSNPSTGYAETAVGQQVGLEANSYLGAFLGRWVFYRGAGIYNTVMGGEAAYEGAISRSASLGTRASYQARGTEFNAFGMEAGYKGVVDQSTLIGYRAGKGSTSKRSVVVGDQVTAKNVDRGVLIGNRAQSGDATAAITLNATTMDITGQKIDLPLGTAATQGWSDGDNIAFSYDPSGLTDPWQGWSNADEMNLPLTVTGGAEYLLLGENQTILAQTRYRKFTDPANWHGSGINDAIPPSQAIPVPWQLGATNGKRDVASSGGLNYLWIDVSGNDIVQTADMEPGVGANWTDFWQPCDTTGTFDLTPYGQITGGIAIGDSAHVKHNDGVAIGRGAETTKDGQIRLGGVNHTEVYTKPITFNGTDLMSTYEIGTFTPVFDATTTSPVCTYNLQEGHYTIIGDTAFVHIELRSSGVSVVGSGNLFISGIPIELAPSFNVAERPGFANAWTSQKTPVFTKMTAGSTDLELYTQAGSDARTGSLRLNETALSAGGSANWVIIDMSYKI